jgi:SsrA-binding protein
MGRAKQQKKRKEKKAETKSGSATVARNKKAGFDFHLGKEIIAGVVLKGPEVKSVRLGNVQMRASYAKIIDGEAWLFHCHISEYKYANRFNEDPDRPKKLLLNKYELERIEFDLQTTNQTLVASKIFFKGNRAKVLLHLAEGKKKADKRDSLRKRQQNLDIQRALKKY